jgi:DNA-binding MarR family transcriptional regulator
MTAINETLNFILNLSKAQAVISRKFDAKLSAYGMGFNDFIILYTLNQAHGEKLRRIDLAEQIGLTASGVTRMLAPMEKTGLVARETNERDARVSYVVLAPGGKRLLQESLSTAENAASDLFSKAKIKGMDKLTQLLINIAGI